MYLPKKTLVIALLGVALTLAVYTGCKKPKPSPMAIPEMPPIVERLKGVAVTPDQLDSLTKEFGAPASLLNFYCATPNDLSPLGLGKCLHIPVMIADRKGGRKSTFFSEKGKEILEGIFVNGEGIALCYMKRTSGDSVVAKKGDTYTERITTLDGKVLWKGNGILESFDPATGFGTFQFELGEVIPGGQTPQPKIKITQEKWLWSIYKKTTIEEK